MSHSRTLYDKLISNLNKLRFQVIEPIMLKYARFRFEDNYTKKIKTPYVQALCGEYR